MWFPAPACRAQTASRVHQQRLGLLQFWMGHSGEGMSDLYDKIRSNVAFRKEMAEKAGLGFELPSKIIVIGRNGRKLESARDLEMTATA